MATITTEQHQAIVSEKETAFNSYATTKSVSQNFLNITAIQSMITILVRIYSSGGILNDLIRSLVILVSLNIFLQFIVFSSLVILAKSRSVEVMPGVTATGLNDFITITTGLILIINSAITIISINQNITSK
jgi:hypothetical protein